MTQMQMDDDRRDKNIKEGKKLCWRCDGTGNELYSMYIECSKCKGEGWL